MATKDRQIELKYNKAAKGRKFNILRETIPTEYMPHLNRHSLLFEPMQDERFALMLFRILDIQMTLKKHNRTYFNPFTEELTNFHGIVESARSMPWKCAVCEKEIESRMDSFKPENFVCEDHSPFYKKGKKTLVLSSVLNSSIVFRTKVQKILLDEQKKFIRYSKKTSQAD